MKNGLLYQQSKQGQTQETVLQFVVPQIHRNAALDGCHREAAHQGQSHSLSLMQEQFWWPSMAHDLRNCIRKCSRCKKFEATPPIAPLKPLACSGPGELLHVDFANSSFLYNLLFAFQGRVFYLFLCHPRCALILGNGCERFCASRSLLGSYVHQELME